MAPAWHGALWVSPCPCYGHSTAVPGCTVPGCTAQQPGWAHPLFLPGRNVRRRLLRTFSTSWISSGTTRRSPPSTWTGRARPSPAAAAAAACSAHQSCGESHRALQRGEGLLCSSLQELRGSPGTEGSGSHLAMGTGQIVTWLSHLVPPLHPSAQGTAWLGSW